MVNLTIVIAIQVHVWSIYRHLNFPHDYSVNRYPRLSTSSLTFTLFSSIRSARLFLEFDWSRRHFVHLSTLRTRNFVSPSTIAGASLEAAGAGSVAVTSQNFTVKMYYWMFFNKTKRLNAKTLFGADGVRIIEGSIKLTSAAKQREL